MINVLRKVKVKYNLMPEVAKATLWFMICNIIQKSLSVITVPFFARVMTTEQYGQINIYNSWLQIVTIIATFRLDYGVFFKGLSKFENESLQYTVSMQSFSTIIVIILTSVYLAFRYYINKFTGLSTTLTLIMILEVLFVSAISYWNCEKRYSYQYKKAVYLSISIAACNIVLSVLAVLISEEKGIARIIAAAIAECIFGLCIYIYNIKRGGIILAWKYIKYALVFNIPLIPHYFSTYILEQSDRIMIQKMVGLSEAGLYSMAYNVGLVMKIVSNSINNSLVPLEYRLLKEKKYKTLNKTLNNYIVLFFFASILVICLAPEVTSVLASDKYKDAIQCIPPVTASCFFVFIWGVYGNAEFYYDANKFTMYISIGVALLNLVLNYFGIKAFGFVAPAYTTLICYIIFTILHFTFVNTLAKKKTGERIFEYKLMFLLGALLIVITIVMTILYEMFILRYVIIFTIVLLAIIYKNRIVEIIRKE